MLDRLPAAARHFVIVVILAPLLGLLLAFVNAVIQAQGLDVDWAGTWSAAINAAAVSAAFGVSAWLALYVTPLTRQYGAFANEKTIPGQVVYGEHETGAADGEGVDTGQYGGV